MGLGFRVALSAALSLTAIATAAHADPTAIDVRVLARGAKFLGGYQAPVRITLADADTGEVLARGQTAGTTGDTQRILSRGKDSGGKLATPDSAVFHTVLDLDRPRRVTLSATGPLSQPQAATTVTVTQWLLPGRDLTAGDGWLVELPGLVVDVATPVAYQQVKPGASVPLRAGVTMLCGCALSENGPWRAGDTEVEAHVTRNGGEARKVKLAFDPATALFGGNIGDVQPGLYEVEVRAWMAPGNNAGVARTAFFVR